MNYTATTEELANRFVEHPIEFGTEADVGVCLYQLLVERLDAADRAVATVSDPTLVGETRSYKKPYKDVVEERFRERGAIGRVRLDASIGKRQQYDVVVFEETVDHPVEWLRSGSKRFDEADLDAAFTLKFIKNKCYPPTTCSITDDSILETDVPQLQSVLNTRENNLSGDIEALRSLPASVDTFFVLVSNNNYLFAEPLAEEEQAEVKKHRIGLAVRQWMRDVADDVAILYVHPRGSTWISRTDKPTLS